MNTDNFNMQQIAHLETSLMPRHNACACGRVWLHKSKSLGSPQNLKVSNEITKWRLLE